jgi:translation elongation factor EF-Tu-like GTPase
MDLSKLHIRASVDLLPTSAAGRTQPIVGGVSYRPNHNFFAPDNRDMCMGFIELPTGQDLMPGQSAELEITFWVWPELRAAIKPERKWTIQEGPKIVGYGTVLKVLAEEAE